MAEKPRHIPSQAPVALLAASPAPSTETAPSTKTDRSIETAPSIETASSTETKPGKANVSTAQSRAWAHMTANVRPTFLAECELIILTICTGMQDAVSFPDYHCFASNQTGNTVFLVLAVLLPSLNGEMFIAANIGVALGFFLAGGWLTGQLGHRVGPRRRWWLVACNLVQAVLVFAAAAVQQHHGVTARDDYHARVVVGLLAFAAGSQVVQSRALAMTEISTAMATAAWVDLLIDPRLFALHNRPRSRRVVFLVALILGAVIGAAIYRTAGSSVAVFVSAGGKALVALMFLLNEADETREALCDEKV